MRILLLASASAAPPVVATLERLGHDIRLSPRPVEGEGTGDWVPDLVVVGSAGRAGFELGNRFLRERGVPAVLCKAPHESLAEPLRGQPAPRGIAIASTYETADIEAAIDAALSGVASQRPINGDDAGDPDDVLERVRRYVRRNYSSDVTLDDMADRAGMSKFHFSRRFKEETGTSPYRFVLETRIDRAKRLLEESAQPIGTIARSVGFKSHSQFNRTFKSLVGVTPGTYRRSGRTEEPTMSSGAM